MTLSIKSTKVFANLRISAGVFFYLLAFQVGQIYGIHKRCPLTCIWLFCRDWIHLILAWLFSWGWWIHAVACHGSTRRQDSAWHNARQRKKGSNPESNWPKQQVYIVCEYTLNLYDCSAWLFFNFEFFFYLSIIPKCRYSCTLSHFLPCSSTLPSEIKNTRQKKTSHWKTTEDTENTNGSSPSSLLSTHCAGCASVGLLDCWSLPPIISEQLKQFPVTFIFLFSPFWVVLDVQQFVHLKINALMHPDQCSFHTQLPCMLSHFYLRWHPLAIWIFFSEWT